MRLQMSVISPMDCDMLAREVTQEDFLYYQKHSGAFKTMWEDQGTLFWTHMVNSFIYHIVNSQDSSSDTRPDLVPMPAVIQSSAVSEEEYRDYTQELWRTAIDDAYRYFKKHFVQGTFSSARTVFRDGCTLSEFSALSLNIGTARSTTHDPFFHKSTREVYRRLFGEPSLESAAKATILVPSFMQFAGAVAVLFRRWTAVARVSDIVANQTPGDIRGMCMLQLLLEGHTVSFEHMRYMELVIRRRLDMQNDVFEAHTPQAGAAAVDASVKSIFSHPPANHQTPILAKLRVQLASAHEARTCNVCRDKMALLTRSGGNIAGGKEITLRVGVVCQETAIDYTGQCTGDCHNFKYRCTAMMKQSQETGIDTVWTNYGFRADTLLARMKPCNNYPTRAQTSLVFMMRCNLGGQVISYDNWIGRIQTMPFIKRVWQLTRAFSELVYDIIERVERSVEEFRTACEDIQKLLTGNVFDDEAKSRLQEFVSCIGVAFSALTHPLCFAWTICGVPEDSAELQDVEMAVRSLGRNLVPISSVADLTLDCEEAATARRSCCSVAIALRMLSSQVQELWPIVYRLIAILQTSCKLIEEESDALQARAVIHQACQVVDKDLIRDIVNRPLIGKSSHALLTAVRRFERDLHKLPIAPGKLQSATGDDAMQAAAAAENSDHLRPHTCQYRQLQQKAMEQQDASLDHDECRHLAEHKLKSYPTATILQRQTEDERMRRGRLKSPSLKSSHGLSTKDAASSNRSGDLALGGTESMLDDGQLAAARSDESPLRPGGKEEESDIVVERRVKNLLALGGSEPRKPRFVKDFELAEYDREVKYRRYRMLDEEEAAEEEYFKPDERPRVDYDERSRANFTFDGFNTLKNSPTCTAKVKTGAGGPGRVNIDVSLKRLNPTAHSARHALCLSEYVPLYSGNCSCTSPFCLKCVNPLIAPGFVQYGHKEGMQTSKRRSSKSERARQKEQNRLARLKKKSAVPVKKTPTAADVPKGARKALPESESRTAAEDAAADRDGENSDDTSRTVQREGDADADMPAGNASRSAHSQADGDDGSSNGDVAVVKPASDAALETSSVSHCQRAGGINDRGTIATEGSEAVREKEKAGTGTVTTSSERTDQQQHGAATGVASNPPSLDCGQVNLEEEEEEEEEDAESSDAGGSDAHASASSRGSSSSRQLNYCSWCGDMEPLRRTYKKCNRCTNPETTRYYCCRDCQSKDWKVRHRKEHVDGSV